MNLNKPKTDVFGLFAVTIVDVRSGYKKSFTVRSLIFTDIILQENQGHKVLRCFAILAQPIL